MSVKIKKRTTYSIEHNEREFELSYEPGNGQEPTIQDLPNGKTVIGYLCDESDPPDPRENDNFGVMVCWHRRYTLGDKHTHENPKAMWRSLLGEEEYEKLDQESDTELAAWPAAHPEFSASGPEFAKKCEELILAMGAKVRELVAAKGYTVVPLFLLDHSGITMSTSSFSHVDPGGWDSGRVGYIYAGPEEIAKMGVAPEHVTSALESEVTEYDLFLTGESYGVAVDVYDVMGEKIDEDACWGYLGHSFVQEELAERVVEYATRYALQGDS